METLAALAHGFAVALTPFNLLWAMVGVTLGTAVGVLPGIGPALTVALLLPVTFKLDPTGAFIMFAGIYYGAMYGGSTTSILLNTPGESATIVTALEGNHDGAQGPRRPGARDRRDRLVRRRHHRHPRADLRRAGDGAARAALRPGRVLRPDRPGLHHRHRACSAARSSRGLASLFFGLALGLVGIDTAVRPGALHASASRAARRHRRDRRRAVGLFAVGETLYVATRYRHEPEEIIPGQGARSG